MSQTRSFGPAGNGTPGTAGSRNGLEPLERPGFARKADEPGNHIKFATKKPH